MNLPIYVCMAIVFGCVVGTALGLALSGIGVYPVVVMIAGCVATLFATYNFPKIIPYSLWGR